MFLFTDVYLCNFFIFQWINLVALENRYFNSIGTARQDALSTMEVHKVDNRGVALEWPLFCQGR